MGLIVILECINTYLENVSVLVSNMINTRIQNPHNHELFGVFSSV